MKCLAPTDFRERALTFPSENGGWTSFLNIEISILNLPLQHQSLNLINVLEETISFLPSFLHSFIFFYCAFLANTVTFDLWHPFWHLCKYICVALPGEQCQSLRCHAVSRTCRAAVRNNTLTLCLTKIKHSGGTSIFHELYLL